MARAYGANAAMLLKRETAYGTQATGNYVRMPFNRCSLGSEQGLIDDPVLGYGRDPELELDLVPHGDVGQQQLLEHRPAAAHREVQQVSAHVAVLAQQGEVDRPPPRSAATGLTLGIHGAGTGRDRRPVDRPRPRS